MRLTPDEASGLTGPQVLEELMRCVAEERESCALVADAMAERHPGAADVLRSVAAQIRARS